MFIIFPIQMKVEIYLHFINPKTLNLLHKINNVLITSNIYQEHIIHFIKDKNP